MAGNHFKGSDSGRPAVPPRPNGAGKAGTPGDAGQGGSGKRVSPGETAMFTALYEQSQKAKKTGRARGNVFAGGATSASQPSGAPSAPANNAGAANAANAAGNVNAGKAANNTPSAGGAGLTGNLGTIYTGASETGTFARLDDSGAEFAGSGSKEDYYDFGLNYGSDASSSSTSDGLVRHRHRKGERKKRHTGAIIAAVVAVLLVALGASGFMLLNSAKTVKSEAKEAVEIVGGLKDKVTSGDFSTLPDDAKKIDELCDSMKAETSSPLWTAASFIPVYGSDINAARTMIDALSDVSSNALVPMADNLSQATPGKLFQDGMINVSALQAVADSLSSSSKVFKSANEKIQGIGDTHISQVTELVDKAKDGFATLNGAVDAAEKVAPVLPQMLGANGQTRNYLMYAMNNVEIRACGGFGGSQGLISVTDGQMSIGEFVPRIGLSEDEAVESVDEEGRLIAWMRNDDEQNAIKETGIDASLPDPDDPSADPVAGVYFNNLSFSKLDWYLNADTQIGQGIKNGDGTCSYRITVTLTNIMTQEEAGKLPDYVAASAPDAARDDERLNVSLFAPTGGNISDLTVEGTQFGLGAATWHGIPFYSGTVDLHAGETTTITYTLTTSAEAGDKPLTLRQTPTCQAARDSASA